MSSILFGQVKCDLEIRDLRRADGHMARRSMLVSSSDLALNSATSRRSNAFRMLEAVVITASFWISSTGVASDSVSAMRCGSRN